MGNSSLFAGRLGLAKARVPYADRHGLIGLSRGKLFVEDGSLRFICVGSEELDAGDYAIPYQNVSMILLGPGSTISHDALRLMARHGVLMAAVGSGGVKFYTASPMGQGRSFIARSHAVLWSDAKKRFDVAKKMYAIRFGSLTNYRDITILRGIEGSRMKASYKILAEQHRIPWKGRRYDRSKPDTADIPNQAINHAATIVESAADIAVAAVGALPPLGFIHESSSNAFTLDIADLYRTSFTIPLAFRCAHRVLEDMNQSIEKLIRKNAAEEFRNFKLIPKMIERIKDLLNVNDSRCD